MICLAVSTEHRRVTDRLTDRQTDIDILPRHSPRYAYASRGNKVVHIVYSFLGKKKITPSNKRNKRKTSGSKNRVYLDDAICVHTQTKRTQYVCTVCVCFTVTNWWLSADFTSLKATANSDSGGQVKVKEGHTPVECIGGVLISLTQVETSGRWARMWINHYCLWRMASATPDPYGYLRNPLNMDGWMVTTHSLTLEGWKAELACWLTYSGQFAYKVVICPAV